MKPKLGIILPTNNPESFFKYFGVSIKHLAPMNESMDCRVLCNFQEPFDGGLVAAALTLIEESGFKVHWLMSPAERPASMFRLRNDCSLLWPEADFYMFADDNLEFAAQGTPQFPAPSWKRYEEVIDYMTTFPNCGVVMCQGHLGGVGHQLKIKQANIPFCGIIATNRGLFFKNTNAGRLYDASEVKLAGSGEECLLTFKLMASGFFMAKQFNVPTNHKNKTKQDASIQDAFSITNAGLLDKNAYAHIRSVYRDPNWFYETRKTPASMFSLYVEAGGDPAACFRKVKGGVVDFTKYQKDYGSRKSDVNFNNGNKKGLIQIRVVVNGEQEFISGKKAFLHLGIPIIKYKGFYQKIKQNGEQIISFNGKDYSFKFKGA
jgi:hypothetical protein